MADHNNPVTTQSDANFAAAIRDRFTDLARFLDPASTSPTNLSAETIRWNSANARFEIYTGSPLAWEALADAYSININGTVGATTPAAGAFTTISGSGEATFATERITATTTATLSSTAHGWQIGASSGANLAASPGRIQGRNNGAKANIGVNDLGGDVTVSASESRVALKGILNMGPQINHQIGSGGALETIKCSNIGLVGEGDTTDSLGTIPGGSEGDIIFLRLAAGKAYTVTVVDSATIELAGSASFALSNARDVLCLTYTGALWVEVSRSDNG